MSDRLVEITQKELSRLRTLYAAVDSKRYVAYMTISNYMRWFEKEPNLKDITFFCLNDDFSDGTFVVIYRYFVFADTLDDSSDNLFRLIQLLDCSKGYHFSNVRTEVRAVIMNVLQQFNAEISHDLKNVLYYLPKEEALKLTILPPVGVKLRSITKLNDIERINTMWKYGDDSTLPYFELWSKYNPNVGAFKDDGALMAWVFQLESGLLGVLQTEEKYYGHGYGSLVTKYVAKKVAEFGFDVYAEVAEDNKPSRSLFNKLGFESVGEVHWILTKATIRSADV